MTELDDEEPRYIPFTYDLQLFDIDRLIRKHMRGTGIEPEKKWEEPIPLQMVKFKPYVKEEKPIIKEKPKEVLSINTINRIRANMGLI